jgi:hypothetical protein
MMFVRRELVLGGHRMLVPGADVEDVTWHGEGARAFGVNWAVVPFKCHAGKAGAVDFLRDFVALFESLAKMIQVDIANVLDGKVINNECKHDGAPFVVPEPGGGGCLVVVNSSRRSWRSLLARMPAWRRPYMPRRFLN